MSKLIKIALVDDHTAVRQGTELLIESFGNMKVVLSACNGNDLLKKIKRTNADVVIMDMEMPERNGVNATHALKLKYPNIKVVALTRHRDKSKVAEMTDAGAIGFVWKGCDKSEIKKAILRAVNNMEYISSGVDENTSTPPIKYASNHKIAFTRMEKNIIKEIIKGLTADEIGKKLKISKRTVECHKNNIFSKVGVSNVAGLIIYLMRNGYEEFFPPLE